MLSTSKVVGSSPARLYKYWHTHGSCWRAFHFRYGATHSQPSHSGCSKPLTCYAPSYTYHSLQLGTLQDSESRFQGQDPEFGAPISWQSASHFLNACVYTNPPSPLWEECSLQLTPFTYIPGLKLNTHHRFPTPLPACILHTNDRCLSSNPLSTCTCTCTCTCHQTDLSMPAPILPSSLDTIALFLSTHSVATGG